MFSKIAKAVQGKVQEIATPENISRAKEIASKAAQVAAQQAKAAGDAAKSYADKRAQSEAEKHAQTLVNYHINKAVDSVTGGAIRGAELVDCTLASMQEKLRARAGESTITIGGVPIDGGDEQQHFLLCGAPGTGKSVEIKKMLRSIRMRGQRAVVYDPSGEFVSLYHRPNVDTILNPLDSRSAVWNPWLDHEQFEYSSFAKSLIPDNKGSNADPFWSEAGRSVIEALLMQSKSLDELVSTGLSAPLSALAGIVRDAGFEGLIGAEKTFQSTRSTLSVYLRSLGLLQNVQREDRSAFSVRSWLENDNGSWLFLSVPSRARDAMRPLISLLLDTVVRQTMALRPDPNRRVWLCLDELPSLQKLPSLAPALAEGRKFGLAAILGVQAVGQLQEAYGKELAAALWGLPKTRLYLRIADAETSEHVSKELGDVQLSRRTSSTSSSTSTSTSQNHSAGAGGSSGSSDSTSSSSNEQIVIERLVLPSQIAGLPDLAGYLKTGGSHIVAKVKVTFDGLPRHGDQPDFNPVPQRPLPRYLPGGGSEQQAQEKVAQHDQESTTQMQEQDMQELEQKIEQYGIAVQSMIDDMISEKSADFFANLTDQDIADFAEIFAERAELLDQMSN